MFLKHSKTAMTLLGVWRFSPDNIWMRSAYNVWSIFVRSYFAIFLASCTIGMKRVEDERMKMQVKQYLLLQYFLVWMFFLSRSTGIQGIVARVEKAEREVLDKGSHRDLRRIYLDGCRYNHNLFFFMMTLVLAICMQLVYLVGSMMGDWSKQSKLGLTPNRTLLVVAWYPEIVASHFLATFFYQASNLILTGLFCLALDPFFVSLIVFPSIRLRMLAKRIRMFKHHGDRLATMETFRRIVLEHQDIIDYVNDLNESLKWYYFFGFLVKSYHISLVLAELHHLLQRKQHFDTILPACRLIFLFLQVLYVSYNGNELTLESQAISDSIFASKWYDHPPGIKRGLIIMTIRSHRPLELWIAYLRRIDVQGFWQIVKAAYTVIVLSNY